MLVKKTLWQLINLLPDKAVDQLAGLKHRYWWGHAGQSQHLRYFQGYRDSGHTALVDAIKSWLEQTGLGHPRILEFGCSGGNKYLLMREQLGRPFSYCGLDLLPEAIGFAKEQFPGVPFRVCDDLQLPFLLQELGHFDLFLAPAVLYYIPPERVLKLLQCAALAADYVLVCDDLRCMDGATGRNDGLFIHPFRAMCQKAGLEILVVQPSLHPGNRHGYFLARSHQGPGHVHP